MAYGDTSKKKKKTVSKAANRAKIADKASATAKKSGSTQDKAIKKQAIARKRSSPKQRKQIATYKNTF